MGREGGREGGRGKPVLHCRQTGEESSPVCVYSVFCDWSVHLGL